MIDKGFNVFTGNRLEHLAEALCTVISRPLSDPFQPECMVVQSGGMSRYISLNLASLQGISSNIEYFFPNDFVYSTLGLFSGNKNEKNLFDPDTMGWRIFTILPRMVDLPAYSDVKKYISGDNGLLKRYQLSRRIADTFDQYLLYRPEMISEWEKGHETHFQAHLWRELIRGTDDVHRVTLFHSFITAIKEKLVSHDHFPERVCVFGISSLPKFHMDVFHAASGFCQVNMFLLNPCGAYWGDILSNREKDRTFLKSGSGDEDGLYLNQGNRLLASMGGVGRDFFDLVNSFSCQEFTVSESPDDTTVLGGIQSDLFHLKDPGDEQYLKRIFSNDDRSIEIHACHSPMRELEILQDRLYLHFENDSSLKPRDIIVMMPDVDDYAPLIHAVFGRKVENRDRIPYTVADRSMKRENRMIEIFLALLDIPSSRFTAGDVLRILDEESVRNAFDIAERDLDLIERWIGDTKIRWGRDGNHRKLFGLPPFEDNSWVAGMKRMILGYAMPVGEEHLFHDILPYDNLESGQAELFGRFVEYIREIFDWADAADQTLTVKQWTDTLFRIVDRFFTAGDESENDVKTIRDTLHSLVEASDLAGCEDTVTFDVIRFHLKKIFDHSGQGQGFIKGGVTFCSMLPMRSIPFSIVCLLGMNANGYPRQTRATGFDLIASHPKPGDRSRRNDDRYLFLESLISARQCFYISYIGRSIRDNSTIEPSVLVSELLDYIKESYDMPEKDIHAALVFEHPLQPFSEQYFIPGKDSIKQRHVSYSSDNYLAAVNGLKPPETNQRFFNTDIDSDNKDRDTTRISIREFCDFFRHPGRYILERVLGISFQTMTQVFENEEPFQIHGLDRYTLENRIVSGILNDGRDELLYPRIRAKGILPLGRKGENAFREIQEESEFIAQRISLITEGRRPSIRDIDYTVGGLAISGQIEGIFGDTLVQYRPAGIKGKDWMEVWITHLVLNAATGGEKTFQSFLGGFERKSSGREWMIYQIDVPENPAYHLENLVSLYFNGIRNVLHFFPETSLVFYETRNVSKAKEKWEGNTFAGPGEGQDPYNRICFRGVDPFETPFADIAIATFEPLFRNVRSI